MDDNCLKMTSNPFGKNRSNDVSQCKTFKVFIFDGLRGMDSDIILFNVRSIQGL